MSQHRPDSWADVSPGDFGFCRCGEPIGLLILRFVNGATLEYYTCTKCQVYIHNGGVCRSRGPGAGELLPGQERALEILETWYRTEEWLSEVTA